MRAPTAHVLSFGCQMNDYDSESIAERLVQLGFGFTPEWKDADLVVFNTCAVRDNAATRVFGLLGHAQGMKREHPEKVVAVHGCMATHEPEKIRSRAPWLDILIPTNRVDDLVAEVEKAFPNLADAMGSVSAGPDAPRPFPDETPYKRFLPIMRGCNFFCTFCIVPYVRGRERYFAPEEVQARIEGFAAQGVREVTLLGQNVNSYRHGEVAFPDLLEACARRFPELKFRFTTSNPWDFSTRLAEVMAAEPNVAKHLHLPVQSGSDDVLEAMNRAYTAQEYRAMVAELREVAPSVALTTDLITGFPGETDEDHEATLELMDEVRFDNAFMFFYSEREGTPAVDLPDPVPVQVRKDRLREVIDLQIEHARERNAPLVGRVEPALVEGPARKSPGKVAARLDCNKTVLFEGDVAALAGRYVPVRIDAADAFTLEGTAAGDPLPVPARAPAEAPAPALAV